MDILIRRMEENDIESVSLLEAKSFSKPWSSNAFLDTLNNECYAFYVAYIGKEHVATAGFTITKPEADISNVCVKDIYRKQGIARKLLSYMMDDIAKEGVVDFTLEVRAGNTAAINLYTVLGFKNEGVRKNFYEQPREDAIIMWKRDYHA